MTEATTRENLLSDRTPIGEYWQIRLERVKKALEKNNFEAFVVDSAAEAKRLVMKEILPGTDAKSVAWGGTMTMEERTFNFGDDFIREMYDQAEQAALMKIKKYDEEHVQ